MKVAVVAPSPVPFSIGGAERLFDGLTMAINDLTEHTAELIKLPTPERSFVEIVDSCQRFAELDVSHFDSVIVTKYPAWMVEHPNKILYIQHTLRGLYDTYHFTSEPEVVIDPPSEVNELIAALNTLDSGGGQPADVFEAAREAVERLGADDPVFRFPGPLIRSVVRSLDMFAIRPPNTRKHFAISRTVAERNYFPPNVRPQVVYHPSNLTEFREGESKHFFTASRLDAPKRIGLIIEAFRRTHLDFPLRIAGTGNDMKRLVALADSDPRIEFLGRVSDDELINLYADALAVPFVPYDEDLGLITLEAMHCGTPVITCSDSGGATELVDHGTNGLIVDSDPSSLAVAFESLGSDPGRARSMASAALETARSITWNGVVETLLGDASSPREQHLSPPTATTSTPMTAAVGRSRPSIVVLSTYPFFPSESGGRIRGSHLVAGLAEAFDVVVIATARHDESASTTTPIPGVTQRVIRLPKNLYRHEEQWTGTLDGIPISDIAPGLMIGDVPTFLAAVRDTAKSAAAIVLSHPYLVGALDAIPGSPPVVLDAVDLEVEQKQQAYPSTDAGSRLTRAVEILERTAVDRASLITACSFNDATALSDSYAPRATIDVVPNGADVAAIEFVAHSKRRDNSRRWLRRFNAVNKSDFRAMALFIASWHPPNIQAARDILDMARDTRDVAFVLAGSHSWYFEEWHTPPNAMLTGFVSDSVKKGLLSAATIALNPMTSGSGTNLKILEYWAAGVPTISTPFGVRGLDGATEEHYVKAPVDEFAEVIESIVEGHLPVDERTLAARTLVEESYDWKLIGDKFRTVVQEMVNRGQSERVHVH